MGMLTGEEILRCYRNGEILIDPFNASQINPNSYNLRLQPTLLVYDLAADQQPTERTNSTTGHDSDGFAKWCHQHEVITYGYQIIDVVKVLDMAQENPTKELVIPDDGLVLKPGKLYLGATVERAGSDYYIPMVEGRSSIGRLGMTVHVTAGFGETGFKDTWTLEITVVHPLRIYAGVAIAQIVFSEPKGAITKYHGKYVGQSGPRASGLWKELTHKGPPRETPQT